MSDLYSINSELMELQRVMGAYRLDIMNKEEEIDRLKGAFTSLEEINTEFEEKKAECLKPKFTKKTFHGSNEAKIETFRTEDLQESFMNISKKQIKDVKDKISDKIDSIEEEIASLNGSIATLQSSHTRLSARKEEVIRTS